MRWGFIGIVTVIVYSILVVVVSGKRILSLFINYELVVVFVNGFFGEYFIYFDFGGRVEVVVETGVFVLVFMNGCLAVVCFFLDVLSILI